MALNLPALRKGASIARPKRGRHGVFANGADDGFDEWKPSVLSDMSTWSQAPSWISATSSPSRSLAPFASEDDLELAPKGWARQIQPVDCNMQVVRENCQGLAEAKRALRGLKPGDWKADAFAYYRKKLKDEGRWLALPQLREAVQKSSEEALKEGCYCLPTDKRAQVRLPQKPNVCWVSMESCVEPEPCQGQAPPPLVISHKTPLEAAGALAKTFKGHPVIVTMEATDFIRSEGELNGRLQEAEARSRAQHEMFSCTNFVFSSRAAALLCAKARQSPQERLNSSHDPAIIVADGVVLFRGPGDDGYPFLTQEEQVSLQVLVAGRALKRPWLQKGEHFLNQDDFLAFSHRLNLMTFQALEDAPGDRKPVLVLAAAGLADAEHRQPRAGIAQALKTWRSMWSGYFEAVVVACGDASTATIIDRAVNTDIYMKVLQNLPVLPSGREWHWNVECMQLSYNAVFSNIGRRMQAMREVVPGSALKSSDSGRPEKKLGRRASGAGLMFLTEAMSENQRPAGAVLSNSASRASLVADDKSDMESTGGARNFGRSLTTRTDVMDRSLSSANISVTMGSMQTTGGHSRGGRRASLAVGKDGLPEDSRALMERHAKLRLEATDHEQELKDQEDKKNQQKVAEILAKAWGVGGKRLSGMMTKIQTGKEEDTGKKGKLGRLNDKAAKEQKEESKQRLETMTLDKKRQIDSAAAILGCPGDLKNYIFKQIEKEIKVANKMKEEEKDQDADEDEDQDQDTTSLKELSQAPDTEEVARVFEEVRSLAESTEKFLAPHWKDKHGGSYSARTPRKGPGTLLPAI